MTQGKYWDGSKWQPLKKECHLVYHEVYSSEYNKSYLYSDPDVENPKEYCEELVNKIGNELVAVYERPLDGTPWIMWYFKPRS